MVRRERPRCSRYSGIRLFSYAVIRLRGAFWKLRIGQVWGSCTFFVDRDLTNKGNSIGKNAPATRNLLLELVDLTQRLADQLTDAEVYVLQKSFSVASKAIRWLDQQAGSLFEQAKADYRHSVEALMGREFEKVRWESEQTAEKVLKGLLSRGGHLFPYRGAEAHDIPHLGGKVTQCLGIRLSNNHLAKLACSTSVRYGKVVVSQADAFDTHQSLVRFLECIADQLRDAS